MKKKISALISLYHYYCRGINQFNRLYLNIARKSLRRAYSRQSPLLAVAILSALFAMPSLQAKADSSDSPEISISSSSSSYTEGDTVVFIVSSSATLESSLPINIFVSETEEFMDEVPPTLLTLPEGRIEVSIEIETDDDNVDEFDGEITAEIEAGVGYRASENYGSRTVSINDNDIATLSLSAVSTVATVGYRARFLVRSSIVSKRDLEVRLINNSGYFDSNYTNASTKILRAGKTELHVDSWVQNYYLSRNGYANGRLEETIAPNIWHPDHYIVDSNASTVSIPIDQNDIQIANSDEPPQITIRRNVLTDQYESRILWFFVESLTTLPTKDLEINLDVGQSGGSFLSSNVLSSVTLKRGFWKYYYAIRLDDDEIDEPHGWVQIRVLPGEGYVPADAPDDRLRVKVLDDDGADSHQVGIRSDDKEAVEGENARFLLLVAYNEKNRTPRLTVNLQVNETGDFLKWTPPTSVQIQPSYNWRRNEHNFTTLSFPTVDDSAVESDGELEIKILPGSGYHVDPVNFQKSVKLLDNDGDGSSSDEISEPVISISQFAYTNSDTTGLGGGSGNTTTSVQEGETIHLKLFASTSVPVGFEVGLALYRRGTSFLASFENTRRVRFAPNQTVANLEFRTINDEFYAEKNGSLTVHIQLGVGYEVASNPNNTVTIEIVNDDPKPVLELTAESDFVTEGEVARFRLRTNQTKFAIDTTIYYRVRNKGAKVLDANDMPVYWDSREVEFTAGSSEVYIDLRTEQNEIVEEKHGAICVELRPAKLNTAYYLISETSELICVNKLDDDAEVASTVVPIVTVSGVKRKYVESEQVQFKFVAIPVPTTPLEISFVLHQKRGDVLFQEDLGQKTIVMEANTGSVIYSVDLDDDMVNESNAGVFAEILEGNNYWQSTIYNSSYGANSSGVTVIDNDYPVVSVTGGGPVIEGEDAQFVLTFDRAPWSYMDVYLSLDIGQSDFLEDRTKVYATYFEEREFRGEQWAIKRNTYNFLSQDEIGLSVAGTNTVVVNIPTKTNSLTEEDGIITATVISTEEAGRSLRGRGTEYIPDSTNFRDSVKVYASDSKNFWISSNTKSISEGEEAEFTVEFSKVPFINMSFTYMVTQSGNFLDDSVSPSIEQLFGISSEDTNFIISIPTKDDQEDESDGSITVTLISAEFGFVVDSKNSSTSISILDNDHGDAIPEISITTAKSSVTENETVQFIIESSLTQSLNLNIGLDVIQSGDFLNLTESRINVQLEANNRTTTSEHTIIDDDLYKGNGYIKVTITEYDSDEFDETPENREYTVAESPNNSATVTIEDDDPAPVFGIRAATDTVMEGDIARFQVYANQALHADEQIGHLIEGHNAEFITKGGTPTSHVYTGVTFPSGMTETSIEIIIPQNETVEDKSGALCVSLFPLFVIYRGYAAFNVDSGHSCVTVIDDDAETETSIHPVVSVILDHDIKEKIYEGEQIRFAISASPIPTTDLEIVFEVYGRYSKLSAWQSAYVRKDFIAAEDEGVKSVLMKANTGLVIHTVDTIDDNIFKNFHYGEPLIDIKLLESEEYYLSSDYEIAYIFDNDDPPIVSISGSGPVVEGENLVFTLTANRPVWNGTKVYIFLDDEQSGILDISKRAIDIHRGDTTAQFVVPTTVGHLSESFGTVTATVVSEEAVESYVEQVEYVPDSENFQSSVKVLPQEANSVWVTTSTTSISERERMTEFTIELTPAPSANTTVTYMVTQTGDFIIETDIPSTEQTIVFRPEDTALNLYFRMDDDETDEQDGTITVRIISVDQGYRVDSRRSSKSVLLLDNDSPWLRVAVEPTDAEIDEGEDAKFTVMSDIAPWQDLTVNLAVTQTGEFLADPVPNSVVISAGSTSNTLKLGTVNDNFHEDDGSIRVSIQSGDGYSGVYNFGTISVLNNDDLLTVSISSTFSSVEEGRPAIFTITSSSAVNADLEISVAITEVSVQPEQVTKQVVTISADERTATFQVNTVDDDLYGAHANVSAAISALSDSNFTVVSENRSASVAVNDNDSVPEISIETVTETVTEGNSLWFLVSADRGSVEDLTVNVDVEEGTGTVLAGVIPETTTIWSGYRLIFLRIQTLDDEIDRTDSDITVTIEPGENYSVSSNEGTATAKVLDNDESISTISISTVAESIMEGGNAAFEITSDRLVNQDLTVNISVAESGEFILGEVPTTAEISDNTRSVAILIQTEDDELDEEDGMVTVDISSGDGYVVAGEGGTAAVSITDNDAALPDPELTISASSATVMEGDAAEFVIAMTSPIPTNRTVRVSVTIQRGGSSTSTVESVVLSAGQTPAKLEISTMDDQVFGTEGSITATLLSGGGTRIHSTENTAVVSLVDDENKPDISVNSVTASVTEGTPMWFLVSSTVASSMEQEIGLSVNAGGSNYLETALPESVVLKSYHRTVFVSINTVDDEVAEEDGTVTLSLQAGANYTVSYTEGSADVVIKDNDYSIPEISISSVVDSLNEGGRAVFWITANKSSISDIEVLVSVSQSGEFISGEAPSSATVFAYSTVAVLSVETVDDEEYEADGSITATVVGSSGYTVTDSLSSSASVVLKDNDTPLTYPEISITTVGTSVIEGDSALFTITSSRAVDVELTVYLSMNLAGDFFKADTSDAGSATITRGDYATSFEVETLDDNNEELDGSVTVTISSDAGTPIYYRVSSENNSSTVNITDDDDSTVISVSAVATPVVENTDTDSETGTATKTKAEFTITSTKALLVALTINLDVQETGSMIEGTLTETVELSAGQTSVVLQLDIVDDDVNEIESRITVSIEAGTKYDVAESPDNSAFVDVRDNDQIVLTPRVYNNYFSFRDEDNNGPWRDYHWGLYEGLPVIVYFQNDSGETVDRDLTINFEVTDSESKLMGALPTSAVLNANTTKANSLPIPTSCDEAREPSSRITVTLKEGDGYVFEEGKKTAEGYLLDIEFDSEGLNTCPGPRKVSIAATDNEITEGGTVGFNITADAHDRRDYVVKYQIANEVGNFMESANVKVHTVRIEVGSKSASSPVFTTLNNSDQDQETGIISATIVAGEGYVAGASSVARVNVLDNDGGDSGDQTNPVAFIAAVSEEIEEGDKASFTVSLNTDATSELNINVSWTVEGDFLVAGSRTLTISTGRSVSLDLGATTENAVPDSDGSVTATLGVGTGYQVNSTRRVATITILDDDTAPEPERSAALHQEVLPNLLGAASERSVEVVANRVEFAFNSPGQSKLELNGNSEVNDLIQFSGRMVNEDEMELIDLLSGFSFTLPLLPDGSAGTYATLWGVGLNGDISYSGTNSSIDWSGDSFSGHLGFDTRFGERLLAGVAATVDESSVNFQHEDDEGELGGLYRVSMTSMQPYLAWVSEDLNTRLRGSVSYGLGEVEIDYDYYEPEATESSQYSASIGGSDLLYSTENLFGGGLSELTIDVEAWTARQSIKGNELSIVGATVDTHSLRVIAEGSLQRSFDTGSSINPAVSVGTRWDGGNNNAGLGIEMTGKANYQNLAGLGISGLGRLQLSRGSSGQEEGLKGQLNYDFGRDGIGIYTNLSPAWGVMNESGIQQLWDDGANGNDSNIFSASNGARIESEVGYGFEILDGTKIVTPFLKADLFEGGLNKYGIGSRITNGAAVSLEFEGTQESLSNGTVDRKVRLEGSLDW